MLLTLLKRPKVIILQCNKFSIESLVVQKHRSSSKRIKRDTFYFENDYKLDLLKNYKKIHGDLFIPKLYTIPSSDNKWDNEYWGFKLGLYVQLLRKNFKNKKIKPKELLDIGFIWDVHESRYLQIKLALLTYFYLNGDMLVPCNFIVPTNLYWPKEIHGLKLGNKVHHIRFQNQYKIFRNDLQSIGFVWNSEIYIYEKTIRALKVYKKIYGDMNIKKTFIVPNDKLWPEELRGFDLGTIVASIRYDGRYEDHKDELDNLGFVWRLKN